MFGLAYVILPFTETPPADAITASLARYQRGRRGDVPEEWLRFYDETAHVEEVYRARITFTRDRGLRTDGADSYYLDTHEINAEMNRRDTKSWTVRFADKVPDIAEFVARYMPRLERHPVTGGFGQWLNGLGRWDWWDLGGGFDGVITGQHRARGRPRSKISSGPGLGRAALETLTGALEAALDQTSPPHVDIAADDNVELVERLLTDLADEDRRLPTALVLPPNVIDDEHRWIRDWPEIGLAAALKWLGLDNGGSGEWREVVRAVYERFKDHWAAGVAYHL